MILKGFDAGEGPDLVILHGMFGQARNWTQIAKSLSYRFSCHSFDLRNHGASPWAPTMDYPAMAGDVADSMSDRGVARAPVIGHSMGGKVAMALALTQPERVSALIVADIAPASYRAGNLPLVQAMRRIDLSQLSRRAEVDALLAPDVPDRMVRSFLLQSLVVEGHGALSWRLNLDALEQEMAVLGDFPVFPETVRYEGPVLFVAGAKSDYIRPEHRPEIARLFPQARHVTLKDAAHWVHADQPEAFARLVTEFLGAVEKAP